MKVVHSDIYDPSLSLNKTIEKLADPRVPVDENTLINLVAKYFYCYFIPDLVDAKLSLQDIERLFHRGNVFCVASREDQHILSFKGDLDEVVFSLKFANNGYGLTMLGDIAPTVAILQDIISKYIDPSVFDGKYQGLDLGTGSGILLLAQYIHAMRNGFTSIHNVGIECNTSAIPDLSKIASKIGFGEIVQGDTTQESLYQALNLNRVSFFSNENIPTSGVPMTGKADPFHQNNAVLYGKCSDMLSEYTQTFPSAIGMHLAIGNDLRQDIVGHHSNKFHSESLCNFEQQLKGTDGFTYTNDWTIYHQLTVNGIFLEKKLIPVHEVGYNLLQSGKIIKLPNRRHRWSNRTILLSEKYGPQVE